MSKAAENGCVSCQFAEWQRTPTGRVKQRAPGKCRVPLPDLAPILPTCVPPPRLSRCSVWPDQGQDCPTYEQAKREPENASELDHIDAHDLTFDDWLAQLTESDKTQMLHALWESNREPGVRHE